MTLKYGASRCLLWRQQDLVPHIQKGGGGVLGACASGCPKLMVSCTHLEAGCPLKAASFIREASLYLPQAGTQQAPTQCLPPCREDHRAGATCASGLIGVGL